MRCARSRSSTPDVVLLDVHMPAAAGSEVIRRVADTAPDVRFLALSVSDAAEDVIARDSRRRARLRHEDDLGPRAWPTRFAGCTRATPSSRPGWPASCSTRLPSEIPAAQVDPELDLLTPREREVLQHIARGYMYKEIAAQLGISAKTVEAHVSAVLRKLQLSSRHELTRWAVHRRLIEE